MVRRPEQSCLAGPRQSAHSGPAALEAYVGLRHTAVCHSTEFVGRECHCGKKQ